MNPSYPRRPVEVKDSRSLEIVKCIVYGGLIEAITSLGIVSSAAASDADTSKLLRLYFDAELVKEMDFGPN